MSPDTPQQDEPEEQPEPDDDAMRLAEFDGPPPAQVAQFGGPAKAGAAALTVGALGVVFGDIGTSPLYALRATFDESGVRASDLHVYGIISLVFWAITIVVSIKMVWLIMRADNDGEGGIMALIALIESALRGSGRKYVLVAIGIFGAALFYGDGMITPAISVLSAVEGLEVVSTSFKSLVIPITLAILVVLFAVQRYGTTAVGRLFGPVMVLWFGVLAAAGLWRVAEHPGILRALSPSYGVQFFADDFGPAFLALGGVVLAVTGAEALYADMGHFGIEPIRRSWFFLVFPALTLNYLGQGALITSSPSAVASPFFLLFADWLRIPIVVLATVATVIASQAVISGAFSVTRQAMQLGFLPRLTVHHTSEQEGQIYMPAVNTGLFVAVVVLVVGFGSSAALASAYGIAVTGTLAIDTILFFVIARVMWHKPLWMLVAGAAALLTVDLAFLGANVPKVVHGGWFPLAVGAVMYVVLMTWRKGREIVAAHRREEEGPLQAFVDYLHDAESDIHRTRGTAVFLNASRETAPLAMRANVKHNRTLHENVVILSLETLKVPHVPPEKRLRVDDLGYSDDGIEHITVRLGFQDQPDVPALLKLAEGAQIECEIVPDATSYFLSEITIVRTDTEDMARWRKDLFIYLRRLSASPVEYFRLPIEQTVTMGQAIDL
ncbi:MAG: system potassium uptake protein [bacterium]